MSYGDSDAEPAFTPAEPPPATAAKPHNPRTNKGLKLPTGPVTAS